MENSIGPEQNQILKLSLHMGVKNYILYNWSSVMGVPGQA